MKNIFLALILSSFIGLLPSSSWAAAPSPQPAGSTPPQGWVPPPGWKYGESNPEVAKQKVKDEQLNLMQRQLRRMSEQRGTVTREMGR